MNGRDGSPSRPQRTFQDTARLTPVRLGPVAPYQTQLDFAQGRLIRSYSEQSKGKGVRALKLAGTKGSDLVIHTSEFLTRKLSIVTANPKFYFFLDEGAAIFPG
jgi:hypothetical protein